MPVGHNGFKSGKRAEEVHTIVQLLGVPPPIWRPELRHPRAILPDQHLFSTVRVGTYPTPEQRRVSRPGESR